MVAEALEAGLSQFGPKLLREAVLLQLALFLPKAATVETADLALLPLLLPELAGAEGALLAQADGSILLIMP